METIRMMVESCVNKKINELKKLQSSHLYSGIPIKETSNHKIRGKSGISLENASSVNNTTNVHYALFGKENYKYITMTFLTDLFKTVNDLSVVLQKVIKELYFNLSHKENNLIFIHPHAYKTITVYQDNMWRNQELEQTLENIIRRGNDILQHYMIESDNTEESLKKEIGKRKFENLQIFTNRIDNMEDFQDFRIGLLKDTEHTIIVNQHLVHPYIYETNH
jgi:hypothetical protein